MRYLTFIFFLIIAEFNLMGQSSDEYQEGKISYITSQNVYVKFSSTKGIQEGDTLLISQNSNYLPALKVNNPGSLFLIPHIDQKSFVRKTYA